MDSCVLVGGNYYWNIVFDWLIAQKILHVLKKDMNVNVNCSNRDNPKDENLIFGGN